MNERLATEAAVADELTPTLRPVEVVVARGSFPRFNCYDVMPFLPNNPSMNPSRFENNPPISLHGSSLLVQANEGRMLHALATQ
jgi:hypothetical protein